MTISLTGTETDQFRGKPILKPILKPSLKPCLKPSLIKRSPPRRSIARKKSPSHFFSMLPENCICHNSLRSQLTINVVHSTVMSFLRYMTFRRTSPHHLMYPSDNDDCKESRLLSFSTVTLIISGKKSKTFLSTIIHGKNFLIIAGKKSKTFLPVIIQGKNILIIGGEKSKTYLSAMI